MSDKIKKIAIGVGQHTCVGRVRKDNSVVVDREESSNPEECGKFFRKNQAELKKKIRQL